MVDLKYECSWCENYMTCIVSSTLKSNSCALITHSYTYIFSILAKSIIVNICRVMQPISFILQIHQTRNTKISLGTVHKKKRMLVTIFILIIVLVYSIALWNLKVIDRQFKNIVLKLRKLGLEKCKVGPSSWVYSQVCLFQKDSYPPIYRKHVSVW